MTMAGPTRANGAPDSDSATMQLEKAVLRALVVGEDERVQQWVGARLWRAGFEVLAVDDGLDALDTAHRDPPDLVVLGHIVARVDVRYVLIQLRRNPGTAHVPILLVAPRATNELASVCQRFGITLLVSGIRQPPAQLRVHQSPAQCAEIVGEPAERSNEWRS